MPGLMRVRERFGRPFPVAVGQIWPGQRHVENGCPGPPVRGRGSVSRPPRSAFMQLRDV